STVEQVETSNEELRSTNEELQSANEELQSTNEELETSKEELQSLNEELTTVNAQLQAKMEEHEAASNDLSSLLSSTDIGVVFLDTRLRIRRYTPSTRDLMDLIPSDLGRPMSDLARKFEDPHLLDDCRAVLDRLIPIEREVTSEAGRVYARRALPYRTGDNRIDGVVVTFIDVTARRQAQADVEQARSYAESIVETLHEPLLVLHPDLTVRTANAAFYRNFAVVPATTVGRRVYDLGNGQWNIPALRELLEDVLPANKVFDDYEVAHEFETLGRRVMLVNGRRLDHVQLILLGIRDVTELRATEARERTSYTRLAAMFSHAAVGLSELAADGRFLRANDALCDLLGYPCERLLTMTALDVTHPEDRAATADAVRRVIATGERVGVDKRYVRADGSLVYARSSVARLDPGHGEPPTVLAVTVDLTDRRRAELAVRASEERFRTLVEGTSDFAIILHDAAGTITTWNKAAEAILGWAEAEAVGRPGDMIFVPEDVAAGEPQRERATAATTGRAKDERWHLRRDGSRFWASGAMTALRGDDGRVQGFVKIMRDETPRKRQEDERADLLASEQAARLEAEHATRLKDDFLATLSHELRTPLSAVLIWAKMLKQPGVTPEQLVEGLDAIRVSAEAQRELIDDLLDTSRITAGKLRLEAKDVALAAVVRAAVDAVTPTAHAKQVALDAELSVDIGVVRADPERVRQIVWNLVSNAVKFTAAGGRVGVGLWRRGGEVEIRVTDTGEGIPADFL
ncbi:MAG TPA: PAS domain S-box protein, partial [Humisphaera sp.]